MRPQSPHVTPPENDASCKGGEGRDKDCRSHGYALTGGEIIQSSGAEQNEAGCEEEPATDKRGPVETLGWDGRQIKRSVLIQHGRMMRHSGDVRNGSEKAIRGYGNEGPASSSSVGAEPPAVALRAVA